MSDITVHIDETLDVSTIQDLQDELGRMEGIEHIDSTTRHPHLMVVKYDHDRMNSNTILSEFTNHGYHAELIGF